VQAAKRSRRLLVATTNPGKLAEYRELLADLPVELIYLRDVGITEEVPETGATFEANARLKAEEYARRSGLITLADDSGLEVAALNGEPGVYSARYGGESTADGRNRLLLQKLEGVPFHERMARFVCVIAIAAPNGRIETAAGTVAGVIESAPRGDNGFGYDPVFFLLDRGLTMAELTDQEKNRISHRAVALDYARPILERWFSTEG
jgi:XTP/dITP diphosphohydrolase